MDMLNSCGNALNQGDGSDFHPKCNWEATSPGYRAWVRAWRRLAPRHGATPAQTYYGSPVKLEKYGNAGSWGQVWEESAMVAEEDWCWDLNPGAAAMRGLFGTTGLRQRRTTDFYFFFWDTVSQTGQRGKEGLCICGYSKGLWDLNEDMKSSLLNLYNSLNKKSLSFSPISGIERRLSLAAGKANLVWVEGPPEQKWGYIR